MAKINGTNVLLYADGTVIALQRGLNINAEQDLPDATTKQSAGWAEHINGQRNSTVTLDALYSTTGLSAKDLITYITGRESLLMAIVGGISYPVIGEVNVSSISLTGNKEEPAALSGNMKVNGKLYQLSGTSSSLVTDPDAGGVDYDTFTISGIAVTSAINLAGAAKAYSNAFSVTSGDIIKLAVFLTLNSGQAPNMVLTEIDVAYLSNEESLVAGLNIVTLTVTGTNSNAVLKISNTAAADFALSSIYLFKDPN